MAKFYLLWAAVMLIFPCWYAFALTDDEWEERKAERQRMHEERMARHEERMAAHRERLNSLGFNDPGDPMMGMPEDMEDRREWIEQKRINAMHDDEMDKMDEKHRRKMEKMRKRKMRERREGTDGGAISGLDLESMMDENGMVNGVFNAENFGGDEFGMADREERMRHREEMQEMRRRDRRRRELDDDDDEYEFDEERYEESRAMREKHQQELRERLSKMSEEHKNRALDRAEKLRTRAENAGFEEDELQEILSLIQKFTEETVEIEDRRQERRRLMGDRDRDERPDVENVVSEMTELADRNRANMELRHEIDSRVREQERERMRLDSAARRMDMGL